MQILIIYTNPGNSLNELVSAFNNKKFSVKTQDIKDIVMFSNIKKQEVRMKTALKNFDAVYFLTSKKLTHFIEPMLELIYEQDIFCNAKPEAFYTANNDLLQNSILNNAGIVVPRTFAAQEPEILKNNAVKMSFPLISKVIVDGKKTQSIHVESEKELVNFLDSLSKSERDCILAREFIKADVDQSVVIGEKVFSVQRRLLETSLEEVSKSKIVELSDKDKQTAIHATNLCNLTVGSVKMSKGFVLNVSPEIKFISFIKSHGHDLFDEVALYYKEQLKL